MKRVFTIYAVDDRKTDEQNDAKMALFTGFLNGLSKAGKKHTCTLYRSADGHETGFVVWYYQ